MILINALGIRDSGGMTVLNRVLEECSLSKSNNYLVVCSYNENINILYSEYKDKKSQKKFYIFYQSHLHQLLQDILKYLISL